MRIQRNDGSGAGDTSRRVYHAKPQMQPEAPAPQSRPEEEADEYDAEDDGDERPRRRFPVGLVIVLVFAVLVAVGGWKGMQLYGELAGSGDSVMGEAVTVEVAEGANASSIADQLEENGVIQNGWLFKLYARYSGKASNLQPGPVELRAGMSYNEILDAISEQRVFRNTTTVTFPEGSTAVAIAQLMVDNGLVDSVDQFLACANGESYTEKDGSQAQADFSDYTFWAQMPDNPGRLFKCEGYLFPDTYEFFDDDTVENYVRTFYNQFALETEGLQELVDADPDDCINSLDDAVILGSFIQEEAGMAAEDYKVSACFHNRLESAGMPLQSNASCDIMQENDNNYLWNSPMAEYMGWVEAGAIPEEVLAAYDTYDHVTGLTAGAISNPGIDAIQAALQPDQEYISEGYLYFVTGNPEGDYPGQYFYAKTLEEHNANVTMAGW